MIVKYLPPTSADEFERLCLDLYRLEWNDHNATRYGSSGQAQQGVDIYGQRNGRGPLLGIQCKVRQGKLTLTEVKDELAEAEKFQPPIGDYTFATTANQDARLQAGLRKIAMDRERDGRFPIHIVFWPEIEALLQRHREVARRYYPDFFTTDDELRRAEVIRGYVDSLRAVLHDARPVLADSGRDNTPSLESTYIQQSLKPHGSSDPEPPERESEFRPDDARVPALEALQTHPNLLIEGAPGSGKSTLLWRYALDTADAWREDRALPVPVLVSAAALTAHTEALPTSLARAVERHLGLRLGVPLPPDLFAARPSAETSWLVIIDGLDEVASTEQRHDLLGALADQVRTANSPYRFVIGSRPDSDLARLPDAFGRYVVRPFESREVGAFAGVWFDNAGIAESFLRQVEEARLGQLAQVPLLLAMAAKLFGDEPHRPLPPRRAGLYRRFVDALDRTQPHLLQNSSSFTAAFRVPTDETSSVSPQRLLLRQVARLRRAEDDGSISVVAMAVQVAREYGWLTLARDATEELRHHTETAAFLRRTGLFDDGPVLEFVHESFCDYLTAEGLVDEHGGSTDWAPIERWRDPRWREACLFAVGIWSELGLETKVTAAVQHLRGPFGRRYGDEALAFVAFALAEGAMVEATEATRVVDQVVAQISGITEQNWRSRVTYLPTLERLSEHIDLLPALFGIVRARTSSERARIAALSVLAKRGQSAALLEMAADAHFTARVRIAAAEGAHSPAELLAFVRDAALPENDRRAAFGALARLDNGRALLRFLVRPDDASPETRCLAALALSVNGQADRAAPILRRLVLDPTTPYRVQSEALGVLQVFGRAEELLVIVKSLVNTDDISTNRHVMTAAVALHQLGAGRRVDTVLQRAVRTHGQGEQGRELTGWYIWFLAHLGQRDDLIRLMNSGVLDADQCIDAAQQVGRLGALDAAEIALRAVAARNRDSGWKAINAMGELGLIDCIERLLVESDLGAVDFGKAATILAESGRTQCLVDLACDLSVPAWQRLVCAEIAAMSGRTAEVVPTVMALVLGTDGTLDAEDDPESTIFSAVDGLRRLHRIEELFSVLHDRRADAFTRSVVESALAQLGF